MNRYSVERVAFKRMIGRRKYVDTRWTVREHVGRATITRHHADTWREAYDYADKHAREEP